MQGAEQDVLLETADAARAEAERDSCLTFVFVGAGYAGVEALAELSDLTEADGVEVDELLRVRGHEHVWALGDCARVPDTRARLPLAQGKRRVVVDWTVALFFRRDIAELGQLEHLEES